MEIYIRSSTDILMMEKIINDVWKILIIREWWTNRFLTLFLKFLFLLCWIYILTLVSLVDIYVK